MCVEKGITETILIQMGGRILLALAVYSFIYFSCCLLNSEQKDLFVSEFGRAEALDEMANRESEE